MRLDHDMFDEAPLSLMTTETLASLSAKTESVLDVRRFRPNIVVETARGVPFPENDWVGKLVVFGEEDESVALNVTQRDVRCTMVNLDPPRQAR